MFPYLPYLWVHVWQPCLEFSPSLFGKNLLEHVPTKQTFEELDILSVNQLCAQIKIREVWKSINDPLYPDKWEKRTADQSTGCTLRSVDSINLKLVGKSK